MTVLLSGSTKSQFALRLSLEYSREVKPGTNEIVFDLAVGTPASGA
jgi:hypothetical protein